MKYWLTMMVTVMLIAIATASAQNALMPILYGQAFDGETLANDAIVTVYPQSNTEDTVTDVVGPTGNAAISGYWKINLNNLQTELQNNDAIVVHINDSGKETQIVYQVDVDKATHFITLNVDPAYQDYDEDGFYGDVDCDDSDDSINQNATEVEDGVDNNCDGSVDEGFVTLSDAEIELFAGWTLFSLPVSPSFTTSEELGSDMSSSGANCDVIMTYDEENQEWSDDILGLNDPTFILSGIEGYYIHCSNAINYTYQGTVWE